MTVGFVVRVTPTTNSAFQYLGRNIYQSKTESFGGIYWISIGY